MNIAEQSTMPSLDSIMSDIERFGLAKNALELLNYGFTVVSPGRLGVDDAWAERFRDAALAAYEKGNNVSVGDYRTATITADLASALLYDEDDVFIEAAINPAKLALVRLMLGQRAVLRTNTIILKGPADQAPADDYYFYQNLPLHTDNEVEGIPMGAGQICHRLNCTWICTDQVDEADGPTLLVPASHHIGHSVWPHDSDVTDTPYPVVRLEAKAGSVAMWQGGTFHSALPRTRTGLRVSLSENYTRHYIHGPHAGSHYIPNLGRLSPELLDRYPELKRVLGLSQQQVAINPPFDPYA